MRRHGTGFRDRTDAGKQLADRLRPLGLSVPIVLGLPRGGVPVAFEVAIALGAPLEVFVARKIVVPWYPEMGIGAIAEGCGSVVDQASLQALHLSTGDFERLVSDERLELQRRVRRYRDDRPLPDLAGRDVILVDDGVATGGTAEAALRSLCSRQPGRLTLGVPVCPRTTAARLRDVADCVVSVLSPKDFHAVGLWYEDFTQTTDDEVLHLLERSRSAPAR